MSETRCHYHRDAVPVSYCFKYGRGLCIECLRCEDPESDCKYRQGCMIWEMIRMDILPHPGEDRDAAGVNAGEIR